MNLNNLNGKKKVGILLAVLLVVVGLVVTILLVQRSQESRSNAEKATTISLTPATVPIAPGGTANLDLNINPGTNQVSTVKFTIKFDPQAFDPTKVTFTLSEDSPLKVIEGPVTSSTGTIAYSLGPKDITKPVSTVTKIGSLTFPTSSSVKTGDYAIDFDEANTDARSIGSGDNPGESVLQSRIGAVVSVNAQCIPNQGTCSWDALDGAVKYQFTITDQNGVKTTGETSDTSATFQITPGGTYTCDVKAVNDCGGVGEAGEGVSSCATPSGTVTPTLTITPTLTPTVTLTSTPTPTTRITGTVTPTITGSVTTTSTPTPTTLITGTVTPTPTVPSEITTTPTLPPTGNPLVMGGIIGGILILLGGIALLIL